jgi:HK97 family phage major capsid protein
MKTYRVLKTFTDNGKEYVQGTVHEFTPEYAATKGADLEAHDPKINEIIGEEMKNFFAGFKDEMSKVINTAKAAPVGEEAKAVLLRENKDYLTSAFFTAIKKGDQGMLTKIYEIEKAKAITEGMTVGGSAGADGGYLVPTLTEASIFEYVKTYGQILTKATVMPMGQNVINLPRYNGTIAGNWVDEAAPATPEKGTLAIDTLTPKKWVGLVPMSNELFKGANPSIGAFITKVLGQAEGYAIDTKAWQNANTTLTGVFYASNTFGNTESITGTNPNALTYANLVNATLGVDLNFNPRPEWYMSRSMLAICLTIQDLQERPIFDYNTKTILGYPVNIIEQAPTSAVGASKPVIIFGDLSASVLGDVSGRSVDVGREGSVTINGAYVSLFENDMSAIRVVKQYAFAPRTYGYSLIKTSAN